MIRIIFLGSIIFSSFHILAPLRSHICCALDTALSFLDEYWFNNGPNIFSGSSFFHRTTLENIKLYLTEVAPELMKKLHVCISRQSTIDFFKRLTKETMEYREKNNIIRKDFMHLLIQLKNSGKLIDDEEVGDMNQSDNEDEMSLDDLVGQAYVFFIAGYETPSNTISYTLHALAVNKEIQERCRKEIFDAMKRHGDKLTYEAVSEMVYVESVLNGEFTNLQNFGFKKCGKYMSVEINMTIALKIIIFNRSG